VEPRLNDIIEQLGSAQHGKRAGQVHLTISRAGLVRSFNHYLVGGSEFDWHASALLLGDEGRELLVKDGEMQLIKVRVPGRAAFSASNPYGWPRDDFPNLGRCRHFGDIRNDRLSTQRVRIPCAAATTARPSIKQSCARKARTIGYA